MRNLVRLLYIMAFMLMSLLAKANSAVLMSSSNPSSQLQEERRTGNIFFAKNRNKVLHLNVGGELIYATRETLTYIPNTILASIFKNDNINQSNLIERDNNGRVFLDFPPILFKHALEQIRRWKNRANRSADQQIKPPSWNVKNEFDEMLRALGLGKYRQSKNHHSDI
ncbi:unnamed protein product [Rotaria sordida]|uniref:Potassium channel tetramerisation-type BTB domain-containing protein n=2 Tax=Rotaria sordida TaxID=392033 RepID=A0A814ZTZ8_9BILA|nr:unnamed protein product [Rotaria sordida]CAF1531422.1 unnamed protein product [Rotaria sordida]